MVEVFFSVLDDFLSSGSINYQERICWNILTIIVDLCISTFSSINFGLLHSGILFGACTFSISLSSWWIDLLSFYNVPFLSLVILFALKSTISHINIATPTFFWLMFLCSKQKINVMYIFYLFTFSLICFIIFEVSFL